MQQFLNRNIALLIILNCMFSVMIPSRDNLLPCSILKGDQQSDLFCTFVRVSALAIFAKCMYSLKPPQWNRKKIKSLEFVIYLKAGVLRQEPGESGWYALQSAVQSAKIKFTYRTSQKKMQDKDHLEEFRLFWKNRWQISHHIYALRRPSSQRKTQSCTWSGNASILIK